MQKLKLLCTYLFIHNGCTFHWLASYGYLDYNTDDLADIESKVYAYDDDHEFDIGSELDGPFSGNIASFYNFLTFTYFYYF